MQTYLVGGAVRDKLLDIPVKDRDWVVVGTTPKEMLDKGFKAVGKDFPVFLHPETKEEYALARTERKSGKGYKGFTFHTSPDITLEDDLLRRDLTVNAIAEDNEGNLIDPFGGVKDIKQGILRHVSDAFVEDPLRVLRIARFAASLGFKIAPETTRLLKDISATDELDALVPERVWTELEKALSGKYPARFILVLRSCNALEKLFPEIEALFGVPQPKEYHPEVDTGLHTIMSLNQSVRLSDDTMVRFATLVHDLGKATTPENELPHHHGHEARGAKIIDKLCKRYRIPNKYRELAISVSKFHLDCHRIQEMKPKTVLKKLEKLDAFRRPDRFQQFLISCKADARGRATFEDRDYPQEEYFMAALNAANEVDSKSLQEQGFEGKALGEEIKSQRIENIKQMSAGHS
ncbi:MAG TPA: multifunctional CCA addition/repair protein [Thiotrichaceae bacterium]|jgi:tRNA nucleotidyltransferase (CCA-adding enzyme)|nr:multifunctional CCA addition/repair protein [Thiotrichaceae bacterium]HIM07255.1 multifunctional CCA addition/repair protein [Gammaproteobacteria bacterium]